MSKFVNKNRYRKVLSFRIDRAFTYGDTRPGHRDRDKREMIRQAASAAYETCPVQSSRLESWMFRIHVCKSGRRQFDIENVPKLFIDAFCAKQIEEDHSAYSRLALFADDTIDYVNHLEVHGERVRDSHAEHTEVEIFAKSTIR